ncbi:hypothetical protein A2U01_0101838, partial [Trifolium medium]|nr:hypothetical protein [Trifolium medium]
PQFPHLLYLAQHADASCATRSSCCGRGLVSVFGATRELVLRNAQCSPVLVNFLLVLAQRASCDAQRSGVLIQG